VDTPKPTAQQLQRLFVNSAVPFVAFGIVDQSVLIYMGDIIDNSVGVTFGLPTLAAAAMGQIFSDTAGVTFGGAIEATAMRLGLPLPGFTDEQQKLAVVRRVGTIGGICGVVTGCLIGMLNLVVIDLAAAERAKKAKELQTIFQTVIEDGRSVMKCERATLWVVDEDAGELWSSVAHGVDGILRIPLSGDTVAASVARTQELQRIHDVKTDSRFKAGNDVVNGFTTRNMIVCPVVSEGKCVAVIQMLNKPGPEGFDSHDEAMLKMLAGHTAIFMQQVG